MHMYFNIRDKTFFENKICRCFIVSDLLLVYGRMSVSMRCIWFTACSLSVDSSLICVLTPEIFPPSVSSLRVFMWNLKCSVPAICQQSLSTGKLCQDLLPGTMHRGAIFILNYLYTAFRSLLLFLFLPLYFMCLVQFKSSVASLPLGKLACKTGWKWLIETRKLVTGPFSTSYMAHPLTNNFWSV